MASCISFARRFGLPIAARSGGHSYAGWSSTTGLMVDVGPMQSFRVDGSRVTVGAGLRLIDFYTQLAARGLAVPGGSCPTVGIAGLTLGGGVGVLGRQYGLTCDNLVGLEMVTADGRIRQVDAGHDPDLLWASQGGGGGNFGIATSFTFTARPLASLTQFFLSWPWSQAARVRRRVAGLGAAPERPVVVEPAPGRRAGRRGAAVGPGRRDVPGLACGRGRGAVPAVRGGRLGPVVRRAVRVAVPARDADRGRLQRA